MLNRFNPTHRRWLRLRRVRNVARFVVATLIAAALLASLVTLLDRAPWQNAVIAGEARYALDVQLHAQRLQSAVDIHSARTGSAPDTADDLVQAGLITTDALRYPSRTSEWRFYSARDNPRFVSPAR